MTATLSESFHLTADEIALRHSLYGLSRADEANLDRIRFAIREDVTTILDEFQDHLVGWPDLTATRDHHRRLERLRVAQRRCLMTLGLDATTSSYVDQRLRIGVALERDGLEPKSYLGAYSKLFELLAARLSRHYSRDASQLASLLVTLHRILAFDSDLAVEAYFHVKQHRLEGRVDALAESQRDLVETARRDSVTQVDARAFLVTALEKELERSRCAEQDFSLLFIDVDGFKAVNDTYGHAAGDEILRRVVESIKASLRPTDIVGRFGGDEFLVGLPAANAKVAMRIAERICTSVLESAQVGDEPVTVSVGCCSVKASDETLAQIIERADRAMYEAKARGRNQVRSVC